MNKLYIVRHGETVWNTEKRTQGMLDSPLTKKGVIQANKLAERLLDEDIDYIYTSDLSRAYDTAKIISDKLDIELKVDEQLREMNYGNWQGLTLDDLKSKYNEDLILWRTEPHKVTIKDAETFLEVQRRTLNVINSLKDNHGNKNVVIVSHGSTIKCLILGILGIDISHYRKLSQHNTAVNIIEFRDYSPVLTLLNDTNHLREVK